MLGPVLGILSVVLLVMLYFTIFKPQHQDDEPPPTWRGWHDS